MQDVRCQSSFVCINLRKLHIVRNLSPKVFWAECLDSPGHRSQHNHQINLPERHHQFKIHDKERISMSVVSPRDRKTKTVNAECRIYLSKFNAGLRTRFWANDTSVWPMILGYALSHNLPLPNFLMARQLISLYSLTYSNFPSATMSPAPIRGR